MSQIEEFKQASKEWETQLAEFSGHVWPNTEEEVTYERMMQWLLALCSHYMESNDDELLLKPDKTRPEVLLVAARLAAMQGLFEAAHLLRALHEIDPAKAEEHARLIWYGAEAGDFYGELLWEWSIEHDVPVHPHSLKDRKGNVRTQEQAKAEHFKWIEDERKKKQDGEFVRDVLTSFDDLAKGVEVNALVESVTSKSSLTAEQTKSGLDQLYASGVLAMDRDNEKRIITWADIERKES